MLKLYLFGLLAALLASCSTTKQAPSKLNLRHYVLTLNGDGQVVVNPKGVKPSELGPAGKREDPGTAAEYLDTMFTYLAQPGRRPKHLLVFINGGLSGFNSSVGRARSILVDTLGNPVVRPDTAFLFICWNSAGFSSYSEHLITHQGTVVPSNLANFPGRLFWGALNLAADGGRTATSLPLLAFQYVTQPGMWRAGLTSTNSLYTLTTKPPLSSLGAEIPQVNLQAYYLNQAYKNSWPQPAGRPDPVIDVGMGGSVRRGSFVHFYVTPALTLAPSVLPAFGLPWYAALGNTRLAGLVVTDLIGRPAWNTMLRRTQVMFVQPRPIVGPEADTVRALARPQVQRATLRASKRVKTSRVATMRGALPQFIDHLIAYRLRYSQPGDSVTVTLLGHSMGTIVASEMLREGIERPGPRLRCDNVVFMAAACTLNDVRDKVVPYLQLNPGTQFYNLTLHPYAELAENMLGSRKAIGGLILDGSLLVYLDRLLTNPLTPQERMAGRWHNFVLATTDSSFIPLGVRRQVTLKAFGAGNRALAGPQVHGDFATPVLLDKVWEPAKRRWVSRPYPYPFWSRRFRELPSQQQP